MQYLNCSRCGLTLQPRYASVTPRHCPRCLARYRSLQPLRASPPPYRALRRTPVPPAPSRVAKIPPRAWRALGSG
jgi:hypothetical protein